MYRLWMLRLCVLVLGGAELSSFQTNTKGGEVNYEISAQQLLNPERGFYEQFTARSEGRSLESDELLKMRSRCRSLLLRMYYLDKFREADLSRAQLDLIRQDFEVMRDAGCKCILRFAYSRNLEIEDAPLHSVLRHIAQLRPVLQNNADVICVMQAGFIGPWGEWHNSSHKLDSPDAMRKITEALLEALPTKRCIQLRTPYYKQQVLNQAAPLNPGQAFGGQPVARIGHHNDCFLANLTDVGTYREHHLEEEKEYLASETRFVPMGGESCRPSEFAKPENARAELQRFHWSYLNIGFHPEVINQWKETGFFTEVEQKLGYRFCLISSNCSDQATAGGQWSIDFELENSGWAAPFNPRDVLLIWRNAAKEFEYHAQLPLEPRSWLPGKRYKWTSTLQLPADIPVGEYETYLWLPDPEPQLKVQAEFAVKLANKQLWNSSTGTNRLRQRISVRSAPYGTSAPKSAPGTAVLLLPAKSLVLGDHQ